MTIRVGVNNMRTCFGGVSGSARSIKLLSSLLLALSLGLTGCNQGAGQDEIRMALAQAPINLDPRYAMDAASGRVNRLLYRALIEFDAQSRPVPGLASWQALSSTHYRFTLNQQGRVFHDGSRLTANDVRATYQSLQQLPHSPYHTVFGNIRDIRPLDAETVDFHLYRPDEEFPSRLVIGILPARLVVQAHDFAHEPIGSGPLKFLSWQGVLKLERVADRQRIAISEVKDPTVRTLKLMRGEIDLLQGDLPPELVKYLQRQQDIVVKTGKGDNFSYLGFNMRDAALQRQPVRKAIAHAIDRQAIVRQALVGGSREASALLPPEHWAGNGNLQAYDYNPKLARDLLIQAGIQLPLQLTYKTSTDALRVRLATIMQAQMRPAGIDLQIRSLDWGTFFDDIKQGKFQLYSLTWVGIKTPEIYRHAFHSQSVPPQGANRGRFDDRQLDVLLEQQNWLAATQRIHEQLPYVPLWYEGLFAAMRKDLVNYELRPDGDWDSLAQVSKSH